jgi:hypothetical protein
MHNPMLKRMLLGLSQRQADCIVRAVVRIQQQETAAQRDRILAFLAPSKSGLVRGWGLEKGSAAVDSWREVLRQRLSQTNGLRTNTVDALADEPNLTVNFVCSKHCCQPLVQVQEKMHRDEMVS